MTQMKSWGSELEFIYACGPRGGSLQILGPGARQKPAYMGRGWRKAGSRRLQKQNVEVSMAAYGLAGLS